MGRPMIKADELVDLWNDGMTVKQLAAHFGVQSPAVTRRLNLLGIKVERRGPPVRKDGPPRSQTYSAFIAARCDELADHLAAGRTLLECSFAMGISLTTIYDLFRRIKRPMGGQAT